MSNSVLLCFRIPSFTRKALQQVDGSPDAATGTESYYEGLQYGDCAVEKCHKCVPPCFLRPEHEETLKIKHFCLIFNVLQPLFATRFERATFRLGVPLSLCHLCSPMYRKVAFHQAFFEFRICFGSPKFAFVVRSLCLHFSRLLDFAKKGKRIVCSCRRY